MRCEMQNFIKFSKSVRKCPTLDSLANHPNVTIGNVNVRLHVRTSHLTVN